MDAGLEKLGGGAKQSGPIGHAQLVSPQREVQQRLLLLSFELSQPLAAHRLAHRVRMAGSIWQGMDGFRSSLGMNDQSPGGDISQSPAFAIAVRHAEAQSVKNRQRIHDA